MWRGGGPRCERSSISWPLSRGPPVGLSFGRAMGQWLEARWESGFRWVGSLLGASYPESVLEAGMFEEEMDGGEAHLYQKRCGESGSESPEIQSAVERHTALIRRRSTSRVRRSKLHRAGGGEGRAGRNGGHFEG